MVAVGSKIREMREAKKMTQKELAKVLNVTPQAVSKWELDKSYPDLDTLLRLSQFFKVSTDDILGNAKESFFEALFAKMKGKINMQEISIENLPKAEVVQVMSGTLKITFDNGAEKYLKSHGLQEAMAPDFKGERNIPTFFGTKITINEDGTVNLNGDDHYSREELWCNSQLKIDFKWGHFPFSNFFNFFARLFM